MAAYPGQGRDEHPRRWFMLVLLGASVLLGMSPWFTGTAVSAELAEGWGLQPARIGWLATAVSLGFVAGTGLAAVLNLADVVRSRTYFALAAILAATANALVLVAPGFASGIATRFLTGVFLAGVYPPAMKMIATWFRSARGLAIGTVVGALTVGKALPYLLKALPDASAPVVILGASGAALAGGALVAVAYGDGPFAFDRRSFSWGLVGRVIGDRETRLATGGYLGHMWELYAMWTWIPAFLVAAGEARGGVPGGWVDLAAFGAIAAGGAGCVWGGWMADRVGRERGGGRGGRGGSGESSPGGERGLLSDRRPSVGGAVPPCRGRDVGLGLLHRGRFGPVQHPRHRGRTLWGRGDGLDAPDVRGVPSQHGHDPGPARPRGESGVGVGLPCVGAGSGPGHPVDPRPQPGASEARQRRITPQVRMGTT